METTDDLGLSRSKSDLKAIRDKKIIELSFTYSIEDLSFLYKLKAQSIAAFLKKNNIEPISIILSEEEKVKRIIELKEIRQQLCEELEAQGLTDNDIYYIHTRTLKSKNVISSDKDVIELTEETDPIKVRDAIIKANQENLDNALVEINIEKKKITTLNNELGKKDNRITELEKELEAYKRKLKLEKEAYIEQENTYESKIDKLKSEKSELHNSNLELTQCMYAHSQRANAAELVNIDLQNRISELENSLNQQTEANLKLQSENEALKKEVETLEADFDKLAFSEDIKIEKIDSKYKKVFDREQIKSVYIDNDFCLKATYESLQNQFVYISYRHLQNILKEEGIYKHTYKVKKKRQKK